MTTNVIAGNKQPSLIDTGGLSYRIKELIDLMGEDVAFALLKSAGGLAFYIPADPQEHHEIVKKSSIAAAVALAQKWPLQNVEIPKFDRVARAMRNQQMTADISKNLPTHQLATKYGLTRRRIAQLKQELSQEQTQTTATTRQEQQLPFAF
jgi:Mor family transcriptional regulator